MFWWIAITIAFATYFRSRLYLIFGVSVGAIGYFFLTKKSRKQLYLYMWGTLLAGSALVCMYRWFLYRATIPVEGTLSWIVVDQRSSDTWVVALDTEELLLRSKRPLVIGDALTFFPFLTKAALPSFSWKETSPPLFFMDEFAFDRWLATKKYLAWWSVSARQVMIVGSQLSEISFFMKLRHIYKEYVLDTFWTTQTAALFLGMTTGDRSWFSREVYTLFVESGLVHLLAVSGSNVVYVSLLLWAVLFWMPFYIRLLCIGTGLIVYGIFCGADSSVIRAISMGVLWLVATLSWRTIDIWRLLQVVSWGMLLWNPLILWYDLWFLLSFCAVVGIVLISSLYRKRFCWEKRRWYDAGMLWRLLPTRWATLGVLPVLILRTWKISLSSIWMNLLVAPLVPVYLLLWWISLFWPNLLRLQSILAWMSAGLYSLAARWSSSGMFLLAAPWGGRFLFSGLYVVFCWWVWQTLSSTKSSRDST